MDATEAGARVRALRKRLGLTQDDVSTRGPLRREAVVKVEQGKNKASTVAVREALARAFGLSLQQVGDFLDGKLSVDAAAGLSSLTASPAVPAAPQRPEERPPAPLPTVVVRHDLPDVVRALATAFRAGAYDVEEFDAVRDLLRQGKPQLDPKADPVAVMTAWLSAARAMRRRGQPVTMEGLALTLAAAGSAAIVAALDERSDALNAEADAELRALGAVPPPVPVLPPRR